MHHAVAATVATSLTEGLGGSDCERIGGGAFAQPVNAATSVAYLVVAVLLVGMDRRRRQPSSATTVAFAAGLGAIGLGSILFHGPQPPGSRFLHDLPIVLTVGLMLWHDLGTLRPPMRRPRAIPATGVPLLVFLTIGAPDIALLVGVVMLAAVILCEIVIHRVRSRPTSRHGIALVAGVAVAAVVYWLGRTDGPVCDPDATLQFHGVWHLLTAALFGGWWWLAIGRDAVVSPGTR